MTSALYIVRHPLHSIEQSLFSQSDVSSPVVGVEDALSSSTHFSEILCDNPTTQQSLGQVLTAEEVLELAYRHSKVIVL